MLPCWPMHCRVCLAETDVSQLEERWAQLDRLWMAICHPVQVGRFAGSWRSGGEGTAPTLT